jgi:hypothetical protein
MSIAPAPPLPPPSFLSFCSTLTQPSHHHHHLKRTQAGRGQGYIKMPFDERDGRRICYYYHFGGCTNGEACPFSHAEVICDRQVVDKTRRAHSLGQQGMVGPLPFPSLPFPTQLSHVLPHTTPHHTTPHNPPHQVDIANLAYAFVRPPRPHHGERPRPGPGPRHPREWAVPSSKDKAKQGAEAVGGSKPPRAQQQHHHHHQHQQGPRRAGAHWRPGRDEQLRQRQHQHHQQHQHQHAQHQHHQPPHPHGQGMVMMMTTTAEMEMGGCVVDANGMAWGYGPEGPVLLGPAVRARQEYQEPSQPARDGD